MGRRSLPRLRRRSSTSFLPPSRRNATTADAPVDMWRRQQALLRHISPVKMAAQYPAAWAYGSAPEGRKGKAAPLQARGMVDRFRLRAKGGDGGNGCISRRRSRSDRRGKPDGGNGGRGGDVILECSRSIWEFSSLQHNMKAGQGGHGVSKNQIGTTGSDNIQNGLVQ